MRKVLLIDGDIIAYELSASTQRSYGLPEVDAPVVTTDAESAVEGMRRKIDGWVKEFKADKAIVCLSDDFSNFRKRVYPPYIGNRTGDRPVLLFDLKDALGDHYEIARWNHLEADDVMGIMATEPQDEERRCIVSADKDMATIPGWVFNPLKDKKPRKISRSEADNWLLKQILMGDQTDCYPGCPGVGPKAADAIIDEGKAYHYTRREITKGNRKGEIEIKWKLVGSSYPRWVRILTAFAKAGLTEQAAQKGTPSSSLSPAGYLSRSRSEHQLPIPPGRRPTDRRARQDIPQPSPKPDRHCP